MGSIGQTLEAQGIIIRYNDHKEKFYPFSDSASLGGWGAAASEALSKKAVGSEHKEGPAQKSYLLTSPWAPSKLRLWLLRVLVQNEGLKQGLSKSKPKYFTSKTKGDAMQVPRLSNLCARVPGRSLCGLSLSRSVVFGGYFMLSLPEC